MNSTLIGLFSQPSPITEEHNELEPVFVSTRVRLARNFTARRFPHLSTPEERRAVLKMVQDLCKKIPCLTQEVLNEMVVREERALFIERYLVGQEFVDIEEGGIFLNDNQGLSIVANEEDHLRLQSLQYGFCLDLAYREVSQLDDKVLIEAPIAYSEEWGFLTACPSNVGTGMRASVLVHVPALVWSDKMPQIVKAVHGVGCVVRGLFGEGSNPEGCFFQISNQQTLGESEQAILERLRGLLETIRDAERETRQQLLTQSITSMMDRLCRAFALLNNAYRISTAEAVSLLSHVRLATDLGLLPPTTRRLVDSMIQKIQPVHLQLTAQKVMDETLQEIFRAECLRNAFRGLTLDCSSVF